MAECFFKKLLFSPAALSAFPPLFQMVNGKGRHQETINNLLETHKALRNVKNDYFIGMSMFLLKL